MSAKTSTSRAKNAAGAARRSSRRVDDDPRTIRTYEALTTALTRLVVTKPLHAITINELVDAAGVHRTTFYGHYPDIFAFAADLCTGELNRLTVATAAGPDHIPRMLAYILEHRPFYRLVFGPLDVGFRRALHDQAATIVSRRADGRLMAAFLAGGLFAILEEWTNSDSTDVDSYVEAIETAFARINEP